jgi:hypothetical protein
MLHHNRTAGLRCTPDASRSYCAGRRFRCTALHLAALQGYYDSVRLLVANGATLAAENGSGYARAYVCTELMLRAGLVFRPSRRLSLGCVRCCRRTPRDVAADPHQFDLAVQASIHPNLHFTWHGASVYSFAFVGLFGPPQAGKVDAPVPKKSSESAPLRPAPPALLAFGIGDSVVDSEGDIGQIVDVDASDLDMPYNVRYANGDVFWMPLSKLKAAPRGEL